MLTKNGLFRRVIGMFLAGSMLFMTACNNGGSGLNPENKGNATPGNEGGTAKSAGSLYTAKYLDLNIDGVFNIVGYKDDVVTAIVTKYEEKNSTCYLKTINLETKEEKDTQFPFTFGEEDGISSGIMTQDGGYILCHFVASHTKEDYSDYECEEYLEYVDASGNLQKSVKISDIIPNQNISMNSFNLDKEGNLYISTYNNDDSQNSVYCIDSEGNVKNQISFRDWVNNIFTMENGDVYAFYWEENGMVAKKINLGSSDNREIKITHANGETFQGSGNEILTNSGSDLYALDLTTSEERQIFNFLDLDIDSQYIRMVLPIEDEKYLVSVDYYDEETTSSDLIIIEPGKDGEAIEKAEITLGCLYIDDGIKKDIINFNKNSAEYRIKVIEYGTEDWDTGVTNFNNDITSGNIPDIIDFSSSMSPTIYEAKGLFVDLYTLMDEDPDFNYDDYLVNVFKAYENGGKLYSFPTRVGVNSLVTRKSEIGDRTSWTMDEMIQYTNSKGAGVQIFEYPMKTNILYTCVTSNLDKYVDWETGKCRFDSDEFVHFLEFVNKDEFINNEDYNYETAIDAVTLLNENKLLLMDLYLNEPSGYEVYNQIYKGDMAVIGYPTTDGEKGSLFNGRGAQLAISAKSEYKEAAWGLIKSLMSKETENERFAYGFPIKKTAFEKMLSDSMKEVDEGSSWSWGDNEVTVKPCTQEEVDAVRKIVMETERSVNYNETIMNIIDEETKPLFSGQKSAKETANVIQSRVQIYINESR